MKYYFDNAATTKVDDEVLDSMLPYFNKFYGNASSVYKLGQISKNKIEEVRENISKILNCRPDEIYFTSGGSESNNLALKGIMEANSNKGKHLITSVIEHPSILNTAKYLESIGYEVTYINVDNNGQVDLEELKNGIRKDTVLVSVMYANNEIGTIQNIDEISKICKEKGVILHTDAVQAIGNIKIDLSNIGALSLSSHKFYGPKGIGLLYIKKGTVFNPIINGGHQEQNKRAGTENIPNIVGMGEALKLVYNSIDSKNNYISNLKNYFESEIKKVIPNVRVNGKNRLPGISNITIPGIKNDTLVIALDMMDISISAGSACTSGSIEPSHVLKAIGLNENECKSSIRISIGKYNTKEEIDYLIKSIKEVVK